MLTIAETAVDQSSSFDNLSQATLEIHKNLDISPFGELSKLINFNEQRKVLVDFIANEAYSVTVFENAVDLVTVNNVCPLEIEFGRERAVPNTLQSAKFTEEQLKNSLINYAAKKQKEGVNKDKNPKKQSGLIV